MLDLPPDRDAPSLAAELVESLGRPWLQRQRESGSFHDQIVERCGLRGRDTYGEAILGSALMQVGERVEDRELMEGGLGAVEWAVRTRRGFAPKRLPTALARLMPRLRGGMYPFSMLGILDYLSSGDAAAPAAGLREKRLAGVLGAEIIRAGPLNTHLIDRRRDLNRMVLELLVLKSLETVRTRFSYSGSGRSAPQTPVDERVSQWCEASLGESSESDLRPVLLSDIPDQPLAYHAFSAGNLARLIRHYPPDQRGRLEALLRRSVRASRAIAGPEGDLAWSGRTTMLSWTLAYSAYAALAAANTIDCPDHEAEENRYFALLQLERLISSYVTKQDEDGSGRLSLVPVLRESPESSCEVVDPYAAEVSYAGTTLLALEWAAREQSQAVFSDAVSPWPARSDTSTAEVASFLTDQLWIGVRSQRSTERVEPRYDVGPIAVQQHLDGEWRWLLHPRPRVCDPRHRSWLQLLIGGEPTLPRGTSIELAETGFEQEVDFPEASVDAPIPSIRLESRAASRGGMAIRIDRVELPLQLIFWLPEGPIHREDELMRFGDVQLEFSQVPGVTLGDLAAGSTHPSLVPVVLAFEPRGESLKLRLTLR